MGVNSRRPIPPRISIEAGFCSLSSGGDNVPALKIAFPRDIDPIYLLALIIRVKVFVGIAATKR